MPHQLIAKQYAERTEKSVFHELANFVTALDGLEEKSLADAEILLGEDS